MENHKKKTHLTKNHLLMTLENELSLKNRHKFTMAELRRAAEISHSTLYSHFPCIDEVYRTYFEERILSQIVVKSHNFDDLVFELVKFINDNKKLSLNIYRLAEFIHRRNYLTTILIETFNSYEDKVDKLDCHHQYLMGGFIYIIRDWFETELTTECSEVMQHLRQYRLMIKKYQASGMDSF